MIANGRSIAGLKIRCEPVRKFATINVDFLQYFAYRHRYTYCSSNSLGITMNRANYFALQPQLTKHLIDQEQLIKQAAEATFGLTTWELVKLRVSQLNQCAYCIAMHTKQAREYGVTNNRIIALSAWQDMPIYSQHERLALELCEKLTQAQTIDDTFYQTLENQFTEPGLVALTIAINAINSWNRVVKIFKPTVEFNE